MPRSNAKLPSDTRAFAISQRTSSGPASGTNRTAVSMAPVPNVVTHDGQRYTVGAVLHDGWCIDSITPNDVILRSGQREIRIGL